MPGVGVTTYQYDITEGLPVGHNAERSTDPKGNTTQKEYDKLGRLKAVTADGKTTTYTYDLNGNRQNVVYPDGAREDYTYQADNKLLTLVNKKATVPSSPTTATPTTRQATSSLKQT